MARLSLVIQCGVRVLWSTFQVLQRWHRLANESLVDFLCVCCRNNHNTCFLYRPCSESIRSPFASRVCPWIVRISSELLSPRDIVLERLVAQIPLFSFHAKRCRIVSNRSKHRRTDAHETSTSALPFVRTKKKDLRVLLFRKRAIDTLAFETPRFVRSRPLRCGRG